MVWKIICGTFNCQIIDQIYVQNNLIIFGIVQFIYQFLFEF